MQRYKNFNATGVAPDGRLFAGDLNAIQDAAAALTDLTQAVSLASIKIGETGLILSRYGPGEAQLVGSLRVTQVVRALGALMVGTYTTTQRNAIATGVGLAPYTAIIFNTTTNRYEWNAGDDAVRVWKPVGSTTDLQTPGSLPTSPIDGDRILVDFSTANGLIGEFRYRASSASAHKWEAIGSGPVIRVFGAASTIVVPFAGEYYLDWGTGYTMGNDNRETNAIVFNVTTAADLTSPVRQGQLGQQTTGGTFGHQSTGGMRAKVTLVAGHTLRLNSTGGVTTVAGSLHMGLQPIRIS